PLPHSIIEYILFQALTPASKYTESKLIICLASTMSGIIRTPQRFKIGPKMELCSVCCSPSGLFRLVVQRIFVSLPWLPRLPQLLLRKLPARAEWLRGQTFWPSTFWRIRVHDRNLLPVSPHGQMHDERHFIRTSSLTSPFNAARLSADSAVPCVIWATGPITFPVCSTGTTLISTIPTHDYQATSTAGVRLTFIQDTCEEIT
ncbi:hypothetical protein B0H14DRAFT_3543737, partial [Mycena olivaceomarginata]